MKLKFKQLGVVGKNVAKLCFREFRTCPHIFSQKCVIAFYNQLQCRFSTRFPDFPHQPHHHSQRLRSDSAISAPVISWSLLCVQHKPTPLPASPEITQFSWSWPLQNLQWIFYFLPPPKDIGCFSFKLFFSRYTIGLNNLNNLGLMCFFQSSWNI